MATNLYDTISKFPGSDKKQSSGQTITFPDVCAIPRPPDPFVPAPYPDAQLQENLQKANIVDAQAAAGNKHAKKLQRKAIKNLSKAMGKSVGDEAEADSATQAVLKGFQANKSMGTATFTMNTTSVKVEGKHVHYLGDALVDD